jgi:hypothetical protein
MRIDPQVNRTKFDRELSRLHDQRSVLESRGIFILSSTRYPTVDLLFVPKHALRVGLPLPPGVPGPLIIPAGATPVMMVEVPSLAQRAFKAHFDLTDYDLSAPSIEFRDPWEDSVLPYATMFRALEFEVQRKAHIVLLDDHPTTHKPFLCLRGVKEYHEHPQHSGDDWMLYRKTMSLFSIVMSLWRVSIDLIHAQVIVQNVPQAQLQVQYASTDY